MIIGVPKEIKEQEQRVSLLPAAIELAVYIERCGSIPRVDEVISNLRSASIYPAARLQLAHAHGVEVRHRCQMLDVRCWMLDASRGHDP